jgi:hypothetical protein
MVEKKVFAGDLILAKLFFNKAEKYKT